MDDVLSAYRLLIADVYELAGASRRSSEAIAAQHGQTAARWHVLSVVSDGPRTVPSIARRLGLTRQAVQPAVDRLADDGLVVLETNPDHARSPLVAITDEGAGVARDLFARSEASRRRVLERAAVSGEDLAAARRVVGALVVALEEDGAG